MQKPLALLIIGLFFGFGLGFLFAAANGITLNGHDHNAHSHTDHHAATD
ncbi:MAG: hypothetical protein JKX71_15185 [Amylibacter sp.]|nr:hypothetical protein [Amylibacter sp.]